MMPKGGGPAFPVETQFNPISMQAGMHQTGDNYLYQFTGMTLRDYFAAKAMQAWLSQIAPEEMEDMMNRWADNSYEMADAMLKAREV
ncbi:MULTISPECIES: hypothetical protein [Dickeya]|nr:MULTISPECIES: hypothetical protein [Dickeya]